MTTEQTEQTQARTSRRPFYLMWLIGFGSVGGAYLLFYLAVSSGLWGTTNHGELVTPAMHIESLDLKQGPATVAASFDTGGSWWLWTVSADGCEQACAQTLASMRSTRVLLNRNASRVRRALVTLAPQGAVATATVADQAENDPDARLWGAGAAMLRAGIYIVDPNGYLVLHYPLDGEPGHVLEDLKKLLKVSQIG
jgi:cytochrome oxidase Cu insertion factor (SCO1/SenC/PrrC family)